MSIIEQDLVRFVYDEARMLDEGRYENWLDLFHPDGIYWMPLHNDEVEEDNITSLFYDDLLLLRVRVARLSNRSTFSQQPKSHCHHLLQKPVVDFFDGEAGVYRTWTPFIYTEFRLDEKNIYSGWATHDFCELGGSLKIKKKKINIIDCEGLHRNIQLFM